MRERRKQGRIISALAAAGVLAVVAAAPSASAQSVPKANRAIGSASFAFTREDTMSIDYTEAFGPAGRIPIIGDFAGPNTPAGDLDDILWYTPGAGGDALWQTRGDRSWASTDLAITGTFTPLVGVFTNDGKDDIFWYAPGAATDSLWDFNPDGSITKTTINVSGTYTPIVGRFTDDPGEDIIWYAPGAASDSWWDFSGSGATKTVRPIDVKGTFQPVVGSFAGSGSPTLDYVEDILWYAPGSAADSLWNFKGANGTITKTALSISGTYTPISGDFSHDGFTDILWYAPGTKPDSLWDFDNATGAHTSVPLTINGTYTPITGEIFEQGAHQTDILWYGTGSKPDALWDFDYGTTHISRPVTLSGNRKPSLARLEYTQTDCCTVAGLDIIDHTL